MKKIYLFLLCISLLGCQSENKTINWTVEKNEYVKNEYEVNDRNQDIVVVSRIQDINTEDKYVRLTLYLSGHDIIDFLVNSYYGFEYDDDSVGRMIDYLDTFLEIKMDNFLIVSIKDTEYLENERKQKEFVQKCSDDYYNNYQVRMIIIIEKGSVSYQKWEDEKWYFENGTKDSLNIQSSAYFSSNF